MKYEISKVVEERTDVGMCGTLGSLHDFNRAKQRLFGEAPFLLEKIQGRKVGQNGRFANVISVHLLNKRQSRFEIVFCLFAISRLQMQHSKVVVQIGEMQRFIRQNFPAKLQSFAQHGFRTFRSSGLLIELPEITQKRRAVDVCRLLDETSELQ